MEFHQQKLIEVNQLYEEHEITVEKLRSALIREIPLLVQEYQLTSSQITALEEYVNDKLTLFRYLRKNQFSLTITLSLLLDTIRWRLTERVDEINLDTVYDTLSAPLCFYHREDRCGRPILIIQLRYLPFAELQANGLTQQEIAAHYVIPLFIFMLETTRKLLLDKTKKRKEQNMKYPILMDSIVLVDFKDASGLPKDISMAQSFIKLLKRFPGTAGMVCLLNFGWVYQGMWQMIKMLLSQEAKNRVSFPKLKELKNFIDDSNLLVEFGGDDNFEWNIDQSEILNRYSNRPKSIKESKRETEEGEEGEMDLSSPPISAYATPTGTMTPVLYTPITKPMFPLRATKSVTSLSTMSKIENQLHRVYSKLGLQKLDSRNNNTSQKNDDYSSHNNKSNAVSHSALSQRLLSLQQQQNNHGDTRQPLKGNMIINNKNQNDNSSIIKIILLSLISLEKKVSHGITQLLFNYRLWIYCFILVTYLLRRRRLSSLPLLIQFITNRQPYLRRYISY
ncbi:unnamed protein product [Cunninghamella blakesleeana]